MRAEAALIALVLSLPLRAQEHEQAGAGHPYEGVAHPETPILVTINAEARLSVALTGVLPDPAPCGRDVVLQIRVRNLGFVTAPIEVRTAEGVADAGVPALDPQPLTGAREELRLLRITPARPVADLTLVFSLRGEKPELGGRDRVHVLMRCIQ